MTKWKVPVKPKIYEALSVIGGGKFELDGDTAKIYSSSGNKFYTVTYDPSTHSIMSNDNSSYWQGNLGYPSIAYLLLMGKIPYKEKSAQALAGIPWKEINTTFKNNFEKAVDSVNESLKEKGVDVAALKKDVDAIYANLVVNMPSVLGKKTKPPEGY